MANSKNFTTNDLGMMIKEGFDEMDKKLDNIDKKFNKATDERKEIKRDAEEIKMKFAYSPH